MKKLKILLLVFTLGISLLSWKKMEVNEKIFLEQQNLISKRWAIFEDDGKAAYFYITEPNIQKPIADCFVYNRIKPINREEIKNFKGFPPPIIKECILPS